MTIAEQHLLIDATNLAVLLLGVSFMARRLNAARGVALPAGTHGKVSTLPFDLPELTLALAFVALLYATVRHPVLREFDATILLMVLAILTVTGLLRKQDLVHLFGFDRLAPRPLLLWSVISFLLITLLTFLAVWFWQSWIRDLLGPQKPQDSIRQLRENPASLVPVFIQAAIVAPFTEEILFRGFLYPALKRYSQPLVALVVTAALFAAIHHHLPVLFPLFVLSCLLTVAYELCGSLWVPIFVHAGFNALNIAITVSGWIPISSS